MKTKLFIALMAAIGVLTACSSKGHVISDSNEKSKYEIFMELTEDWGDLEYEMYYDELYDSLGMTREDFPAILR